MDSITFLGTGGGRFVLLTQKRYSGGIWLELGGVRVVVDPGPGSLVRALEFKFDPGTLDAVFSSHMHLDHYNDVEVMVEAMTHGLGRKKGLLVLQKDVVEYISEYHRKSVETITPEPGELFHVKGLSVRALPTLRHADSLGFRFNTSSGAVTYSGDTAYGKEVVEGYAGSRILILNTIFPSGSRARTHLCTDDAVEIAGEVRPELLVITHFGVRMLGRDPEREAERISGETGVRTVAARDGMRINVGTLGHD
ncbi:MAG: MBL fold metallo-hydrolase [Candidatus Altiarchaeota archaeon]